MGLTLYNGTFMNIPHIDHHDGYFSKTTRATTQYLCTFFFQWFENGVFVEFQNRVLASKRYQ